MNDRTYAFYFATSMETYFAHATNFVDAADSLSDAKFGLTKQVLYAHGIELALKAFLLASNLQPFEELRGTVAFNPKLAAARKHVKKEYGHRIVDLWRAAAEAALPIPTRPPDWCARLDAAYSEHKYPDGATAYIVLDEEEKSEIRNALIAIASALK